MPSPEKKESSSPVIKDIDGHLVMDGSDSNQHSTSRLSGGGEGEVRENKPLVKGMDLPNVLDELFNSDLPTNSIKTQQDEAKIQSITKNLEATGASILQQSQHNYSHPLPNILTQPRNDAMLSPSLHSVTAALNSASNLSTNTFANQYSVPVDQARLLHQGSNQNDLISKAMDGAGLKILSPIRLNEKHVHVPGSNSPGATEPGRVLVQHQKSGLAQATGAQPNSIFLSQNKPVVSPITSLSGPVTSIALASVSVPLSGLPVSGVVISHPAQVRPGLPSVVTTQVRPSLASPQIRPGLSLASNTLGPGVSAASLQMGPGGVSPQAQVRPCCSCAQCPMAGTPRGPRPAQPSAPSPLRQPAPSPAASVKPEVIDLSDEEVAPALIKSATLDKLRANGISVSKHKVPQIPSNVRLPPGISLSVTSNSVSSSHGDGANNNVASAITAVGGRSNEPKQRVELELSDKQMNAMRAFGLL